jgi:hypothetical protein
MSTFKPGPPHPIQVGNFNLFAEDRRREREAALQKIREEHTIYLDGRHPSPTDLLQRAIRSGDMKGPWRDLALVPKMEAEARKKAKLEAEELVMAPEPIFEEE